MKKDYIEDVLLGLAVGDAIGVPVEFVRRNTLKMNPVTGMRAFGSHQQPAGTWSDDSSLAFCLAEMLCGPYDLEKLARMFINWKTHGWWTPHGKVFDIGIATSGAIERLATGVPPLLAGGNEEGSKGNGSLMRILPLLTLLKDQPISQRFQLVEEVSSLTHRHIRSIIACFIYLETALSLLNGEDKHKAYKQGAQNANLFLQAAGFVPREELDRFGRFLSGDLGQVPEHQIYSTGYVIHTLEAAVWCLLNTDDYATAVLKAANLGDDTDTTAAVTGGIAALLYGWQTIPRPWLTTLARLKGIEELADRLYAYTNKILHHEHD
jgi:ADP-ribosyl-[dinitrogen reductase] hydrolase